MAHWLDTVIDILKSDETNLVQLAKIAGCDAKTFYLGTSLNGVNICDQDLTELGAITFDIDQVIMNDQTKTALPSKLGNEGITDIYLIELLNNGKVLEAVQILVHYSDETKILKQPAFWLHASKKLRKKKNARFCKIILKDAIHRFPDNWAAHKWYFDYLKSQHQFKKIVVSLEELIAKGKCKRLAFSYMVNLYFSQYSSQETENMLAQYLNESHDYRIYIEIGKAYIKVHNKKGAIIAFHKALEHQENHSSTHVYLGKLYYSIGNLKQSDSHFRLALKHTTSPKKVLDRYIPILWKSGQYKEIVSIVGPVLARDTNISDYILEIYLRASIKKNGVAAVEDFLKHISQTKGETDTNLNLRAIKLTKVYNQISLI